ncbi:MAG: OmpH family outer membrane protein [Hymenobacter sp.]
MLYTNPTHDYTEFVLEELGLGSRRPQPARHQGPREDRDAAQNPAADRPAFEIGFGHARAGRHQAKATSQARPTKEEPKVTTFVSTLSPETLFPSMNPVKTLRLTFAAALLTAGTLAAHSAQAQAPLKIGYTSVQYVLSQMPESKQIESSLKTYNAQLEAQMKSKYTEYQTKLDAYQKGARHDDRRGEGRQGKGVDRLAAVHPGVSAQRRAIVAAEAAKLAAPSPRQIAKDD